MPSVRQDPPASLRHSRAGRHLRVRLQRRPQAEAAEKEGDEAAMNSRVKDLRKSGHKGTHIIFWNYNLFPCGSLVCVEIHSSLRAALQRMRDASLIAQSLHDASGHLIAYTKDGEVVMCSA